MLKGYHPVRTTCQSLICESNASTTFYLPANHLWYETASALLPAFHLAHSLFPSPALFCQHTTSQQRLSRYHFLLLPHLQLHPLEAITCSGHQQPPLPPHYHHHHCCLLLPHDSPILIHPQKGALAILGLLQPRCRNTQKMVSHLICLSLNQLLLHWSQTLSTIPSVHMGKGAPHWKMVPSDAHQSHWEMHAIDGQWTWSVCNLIWLTHL